MQRLSKTLEAEFIGDAPHIVFSGANVVGEGESKICHFIRDSYRSSASASSMGTPPMGNVAFYGLDNDIIMLSLLHLYTTQNIYVFREEPEPPTAMTTSTTARVCSGATATTDNTFIFINIKALTQSILYEMNCKDPHPSRVMDYVFICFFLGNDFMPRFPSLQIRTNGINILLDIYRENIGKYNNRRLVNHSPPYFQNTKGMVLNWGWILLFIQKLAVNEHKNLLEEHNIRWRMSSQPRDTAFKENPENMPIIYRPEELFISPEKVGWEYRYYKALFGHLPEFAHGMNDNNIKRVCDNYLEGLEWTFKYYSAGCPNWEWVYDADYSPLLQDLQLFVPKDYNWEFFGKKTHVFNPRTPDAQLDYVLPPPYNTIEEKRAHIAKTRFLWAYTRYLWESHLIIKSNTL